MLEKIPPSEPQQIAHIAELTVKQLQSRYQAEQPVLRGVHAKSHGCVTATFEVLPNLQASLQHGVFAQPGKQYSAWVRFSNAAVAVTPDSKPGSNGAGPIHGSRGMAIKLMGVEGPSLGFVHGAATQDFLMVNQPVFAFANVEDYEALSQVLLEDKDVPDRFFQRLPPPGTQAPTASQLRAFKTLQLIKRIQSSAVEGETGAFQVPPSSPVDNDYFSAAPFLLGPDQVMRFRARPVAPSHDTPDISDSNYLRTALVQRLCNKEAGDVVFHFEVQVRQADSIDPVKDIENASEGWPDEIPYQPVATLTIPLQKFDTPEQREHCERLVFTPWHGLEAHRPLGGINRLRRAVYEASAMFRNLPKEPAGSAST